MADAVGVWSLNSTVTVCGGACGDTAAIKKRHVINDGHVHDQAAYVTEPTTSASDACNTTVQYLATAVLMVALALVKTSQAVVPLVVKWRLPAAAHTIGPLESSLAYCLLLPPPPH